MDARLRLVLWIPLFPSRKVVELTLRCVSMFFQVSQPNDSHIRLAVQVRVEIDVCFSCFDR